MTEDELKLLLLNTDMFINNEYLTLYINLVISNQLTKTIYGKTQRHHILQRKWYNKNNMPIDNSKTNLVNLLYKDHILAHYYLYKCTVSWLKKANAQTLVNMLNLKCNEAIAEQLFKDLDTLQADYELMQKERCCEQLDRTILYQYYVVEDHSRAETARYMNTSISCVDKCLLRYGMNLCKVKTQNRDKLDTELVKDLYINKDFTLSKLADYFGVSTGKIKYILRGLNVKKDMHKPCKNRQQISCTRDELYKLFIIDNKSYSELAKLFNVSVTTVKKYLRKYGIRKIQSY